MTGYATATRCEDLGAFALVVVMSSEASLAADLYKLVQADRCTQR